MAFANVITHIFTTIASAVNWLSSWNYQGIPFLYYLVGLAVTGILLRSIF